MARSLQSRITVVTIAVALIAVVVTGIVTLQFVRSNAVADARAQLSAQSDLLAGLPAATQLSEITDRMRTALGDVEAGVVTPAGEQSGAAALLGPQMVERVTTGEPVSATVRRNGELVLIEARPTDAGGAIVLARPRSSIDRAADGTAMRLALAVAIGLAIAILGGALLARGVTRPLARAAAAARLMAAGKRGVASKSSPRDPDEVRAVSAALATLDDALASSEGRQREFLLSISHELRTPLTALRGYAEALSDGLITGSDVERVGRTLVDETNRLDRFVADLLELARLEADDFSVQSSSVDAADILDQAHQAWRGQALVLGVELELQPSAALTTNTDARRVRQLIDGLIENALRVSPAGSAVTLSARRDAEALAIEVTDEGPGLSDDDLRVALHRGALRDRHRDSRPVGTGLGLSIAARLASRLGGTITAGHNPDGAGARFTVTLPR